MSYFIDRVDRNRRFVPYALEEPVTYVLGSRYKKPDIVKEKLERLKFRIELLLKYYEHL